MSDLAHIWTADSQKVYLVSGQAAKKSWRSVFEKIRSKVGQFLQKNRLKMAVTQKLLKISY